LAHCVLVAGDIWYGANRSRSVRLPGQLFEMSVGAVADLTVIPIVVSVYGGSSSRSMSPVSSLHSLVAEIAEKEVFIRDKEIRL
jgi:hypothetical protein